jgi:hypothetical protein
MFSPLRNRFGIPGAISVIALVFAMLGGAYAATDNSGGGKATASAKGKPGPRGPRGKPGPAGPAGPAGPQGPAGANGAKGDAGAKGDKGDTGNAGSPGSPGAPGADGEDGKGVIAASFEGTGEPVGNPCKAAGGTEIEVEESEEINYACNGKNGNPAEFPKELPPGVTETGTWAFSGTEADTEGVYAPISFPIKLAEALPREKVHIFSDPDFAAKCPGIAANPKAPPGELCVFFKSFEGESLESLVNAKLDGITKTAKLGSEEEGASPAGAALHFTMEGVGYGIGTWAVTG